MLFVSVACSQCDQHRYSGPAKKQTTRTACAVRAIHHRPEETMLFAQSGKEVGSVHVQHRDPGPAVTGRCRRRGSDWHHLQFRGRLPGCRQWRDLPQLATGAGHFSRMRRLSQHQQCQGRKIFFCFSSDLIRETSAFRPGSERSRLLGSRCLPS